MLVAISLLLFGIGQYVVNLYNFNDNYLRFNQSILLLIFNITGTLKNRVENPILNQILLKCFDEVN